MDELSRQILGLIFFGAVDRLKTDLTSEELIHMKSLFKTQYLDMFDTPQSLMQIISSNQEIAPISEEIYRELTEREKSGLLTFLNAVRKTISSTKLQCRIQVTYLLETFIVDSVSRLQRRSDKLI